jgi:hypothetical protein
MHPVVLQGIARCTSTADRLVRMSWLKRSLFLAVGAASWLSMTACGGFGPGDYRVYRIAFQQTEQAEDCFATGMIPVDQQDDSSSLFTSGTFVLYVGADETPYLDTGAVTLAGSENGDDYTFAGANVDVSFQGDMQEIRIETRSEMNITLTLDGDVIQGTVQEKTQQSCQGATCPDPPSSSCTQTTPFVGGLVEDVELQHEV